MFEGASERDNTNEITAKARAQLEVPLILEEMGIANFEELMDMEYETILEISKALGERMDELKDDNENRHTVELLARYRVIVENIGTAKGTLKIAEQEHSMFADDLAES